MGTSNGPQTFLLKYIVKPTDTCYNREEEWNYDNGNGA
jgi:hypothetical protein